MNGSGYSQRRSTANIIGGNAAYFGNSVLTGGNSSATNNTFNMTGSGSNAGGGPSANYYLSSATPRRSSRHVGHTSGTTDTGAGTGTSINSGILSDSNQSSSLDLASTTSDHWGCMYPPSNLPPPPAPPQNFYPTSSANTLNSPPPSAGSGIGSGSFTSSAIGSSHSYSQHGHGHSSHAHGHSHHYGHYPTHHHHSATSVSGGSLGVTGITGGSAASNAYNSSDAAYFSSGAQQMVTRSAAASMSGHQSSAVSSHHGNPQLGSGPANYLSSSSLGASDDFAMGVAGSGGGSSAYAGYADTHRGSNSYMTPSNKRKKASYSRETKREQYDEERIADAGDDKRPKQRATKACDKCREQKCKCVRDPDHPSTCSQCFLLGVTCTYRGPSHKRGPPKGYLSAVINRLEAMEDTILSKLSRSTDDPRARALLQELIGDVALQQVLSGRLKFGLSDRKDTGSASGSSYNASSSVKKGSGPNGTTWQDTWWVSTPGLPAPVSKFSTSRSLSSRFPPGGTGSVSGDIDDPLSEFQRPTLPDGNPVGSSAATVGTASEFQPSEELSPKSLERAAMPGPPMASSAVGSVPMEWTNQPQHSAYVPMQQQISERSLATPLGSLLPVAEFGHDLSGFWMAIRHRYHSSARKGLASVRLSILLGPQSRSTAPASSITLRQAGHGYLARLAKANDGRPELKTSGAFHDVPSALERPSIRGGVCYLNASYFTEEAAVTADEVAELSVQENQIIDDYFTSDVHRAFPILHHGYFQAMRGSQQSGDEVLGLRDVQSAMLRCMTKSDSSFSAHARLPLNSNTQGISLLAVIAHLLAGFEALTSARFVQAAGFVSVAITWAEQLGVHSINTQTQDTTMGAEPEVNSEQLHASQLAWSGCVVLAHSLNAAGFSSTLRVHHAAIQTSPFLSTDADAIRRAFGPTDDVESAAIPLIGLGSLHTLSYLMDETFEVTSQSMLGSSILTEDDFLTLDRRFARWSGLVEASLASVLHSGHTYSGAPSFAATAPSKDSLRILTHLLSQYAILSVNARLTAVSSRLRSSQKACLAITETMSPLLNSRDEALSRVLMQPWPISAVFGAGVEVVEMMSRSERSTELQSHDLKRDWNTIRAALQSQRGKIGLLAFYDDLLGSVSLPTSFSGASSSEFREGGPGASGGDANSGGPDFGGSRFEGPHTSQNQQHHHSGPHHRNTASSSSGSNPFNQPGSSYSSSTEVSEDIEKTPLASRSRRHGVDFGSTMVELDQQSSAPETPTPVAGTLSDAVPKWRGLATMHDPSSANEGSDLRYRHTVSNRGQQTTFFSTGHERNFHSTDRLSVAPTMSSSAITAEFQRHPYTGDRSNRISSQDSPSTRRASKSYMAATSELSASNVNKMVFWPRPSSRTSDQRQVGREVCHPERQHALISGGPSKALGNIDDVTDLYTEETTNPAQQSEQVDRMSRNELVLMTPATSLSDPGLTLSNLSAPSPFTNRHGLNPSTTFAPSSARSKSNLLSLEPASTSLHSGSLQDFADIATDVALTNAKVHSATAGFRQTGQASDLGGGATSRQRSFTIGERPTRSIETAVEDQNSSISTPAEVGQGRVVTSNAADESPSDSGDTDPMQESEAGSLGQESSVPGPAILSATESSISALKDALGFGTSTNVNENNATTAPSLDEAKDDLTPSAASSPPALNGECVPHEPNSQHAASGVESSPHENGILPTLSAVAPERFKVEHTTPALLL